MIIKRLKIIDDLSQELNSLKETFEGMLEDDPQYQDFQEEENKIKEERKEKKDKIMANSAYKDVNEQLKEKRQDIKENKEALAQELVEYYKETGSLEFTDQYGETKRLKFSVRLIN